MLRKTALHDGHQNWCAWCLKYISKFQKHHPVRRSFTSKHLNWRAGAPYLLPAHQDCHYHLDLLATGLEGEFSLIRRDPRDQVLTRLDKMHTSGFYAAELQLRCALHTASPWVDKQNDHWVGNLYRSACGIPWAKRAMEHILGNTGLPIVGLYSAAQAANYYATMGEMDWARRNLEIAIRLSQDPRFGAGDDADDLLMRKTAILLNSKRKLISPDHEVAQKMLDRTIRYSKERGLLFSVSTGMVVKGALYLKRGEPGDLKKARRMYDAAWEFRNDLSWQYVAEIHLFNGLLECVGPKPNFRKAYQLLVLSQFIFAVVGTPSHCHYTIDRAPFHGADIHPEDILVYIDESKVRLSERTALREAILGRTEDPDFTLRGGVWRMLMTALSSFDWRSGQRCGLRG